MARSRAVPALSGEDVAEAARMLRAIVEAVPALTPVERGVARLAQGAAVAYDSLAGGSPERSTFETRS